MGTSPLLCCLLWATIFSISEAQSPWFLITAPRLLHLGLGEDVWVQVEWPQGVQAGNRDVNVEMYLRSQITYQEYTNRYTVTLNQTNNYITRQNIELTPPKATRCQLDEKKRDRYVQLVVNSTSISVKPQVVSIPVSYKKGYLFIQTDKSIYTPKETVKFRVFSLDHMMRPTLELSTYTVSNPEGLQVARSSYVASLKYALFRIPDFSNSGVWKISAYYNSAPESNSTAEFEVKKYVLPNFEVKIIPERPYFLISEKEVKINIEARYVYGEPVSGITYVRLEIIGQDGQKTILSGLEQNVKLKEGVGKVLIRKDDIVKKISQPEENLVGSTLYIVVSVMETTSGALEEKELTSVKFVRSPYILDLSKTKRYFNPGAPVLVVAEVTHTDGSLAPGVTVKLFISSVEQGSLISDNNGRTFFQISTDANQKSFELKVTAGDDGARQEEPLNLTPYNSKANSFLHMEMPNQILSPGEKLKVSMKVFTLDPGKVKKVYYMILNKGQILDLQSIDRKDFMAVDIPVTTRMVPSFRIIAYYYLSSEIVANSVWVDVTDACEGKLELRTNVLDSIKPGRTFQLTIETDDSTSVFLSAVDTAVYVLNSKNKLTPSKVFKAMNAYDLGCSPGSGKDYKSVFMDAGLAFISSSGYSDMNEFGCKVSQRKKRSLDSSAFSNQRAQTEDEEDEFTDEIDVQVCSFFPESWLWRTINVRKKHSEIWSVPDSITTWEIQGVGMSEGKGFCVADPIKVKVFKQFYVQLQVPYSVKRLEQLELRPVLYNYHDTDMKVKVSLEKTEGICSATTAEGDRLQKIVTVPSNSVISVPFVVVPIGKGNLMVTVKALGPYGIGDIVKKPLQIMMEGVSVLEEKTYILDPNDKGRSEFIIDMELPYGNFHCSMKMIMDSPMNTINNTLSSDGVSRLIRVPHGSGEQTMMSMSPGVYALRYLDHTDKWTSLPPDRKDEGLENMWKGYLRILQYRKTDGSYAAWLHRTSSTWLTAFVVKVMSLCRKYIGVDLEEIRKSATYLTTKQSITGAFSETITIIQREIMGGVGENSADADVSLTAYVLVALHHAKKSMPKDDIKVKSSISNAIAYLHTTLKNVKEPYPLAIIAYALNLASSDSILKDLAYSKLMSTAQEDGNNNVYFGPTGTTLAIEATSYALLTALLQDDIHNATKMYVWLSEQENVLFKYTQDTVMALEALCEYWIKTHAHEKNQLLVEVSQLGKFMKKHFVLQFDNRNLEELEMCGLQRSMGTKLKVKVSGKGTGVLKILKMNYITQAENSSCSQLELTVKVHGHINAEDEQNEYDYDDEGEAMSDGPMGNTDWHDLRSRARREVSWPKVLYEVCFRRKSQTPASGMAIADITLLSGFELNTQGLNKLKDGLGKNISHYEVQVGRLIMYFEKVSKIRECVTFEAVQTVKISPLQTASAILYDFYQPENQCRVFYRGLDRPNPVSMLCSEDMCQCAEGSCPTRQCTLELRGTRRRDFACSDPRVEFGYRVSVGDKREEDEFIVYTVHILEVLHKNSDEDIAEGDTRYFYQLSSCKIRLSYNEYLIMGQDGQTKDEKGRMRYLLESNAWVEELAGPETCKATRYRNACNEVKTFMDDYRKNGCMV